MQRDLSLWRQWRWLLAVLTADLLVIVLVSLSIRHSYRVHEQAAAVTTRNTAKLLSHDLAAGLDKIDLALLTLKDELEARPDQLDPVTIAAAADRQFQRHSRLEFLRVTDAAGNVMAGSGLPTTNRINISQRTYFIRLRDDADAGLVVSEPLESYGDKLWSIVLARRLDSRNGDFAGVVFAVVTLKSIQDQFAGIDLGSNSAISLRALDLSTVTRFPPPEAAGILPGDKSVTAEWRSHLARDPNSGTYHAVSPDKVARLLSYDKVPGYPFYVVVGQSPIDYSSSWRKELAATMALTLAILATSFVIVHGWRRRSIDARRIVDLQARALQSSREHLKLAIDGAEMGTWIANVATRTTTTSDKARAILGGPEQETTDTAYFLRIVHPDDRKIVAAAIRRSLDDGARFELRARIRHPVFGFRWVHVTGQWLGDNGPREIMIGIIRDITSEIDDIDALKRAKADAETALEAYAASERELRQLTCSLEQRVQNEVARREAVQARLAHAQRMEAVGQLAGGIAHDLNNVIQVVQGCAEIVEATDDNPPQTRRMAQIMLDATTRGAAITNRLLAFSRRSDLSADHVDVSAMLEALRDMLSHTLGDGIGIELLIEPGLPALKADKSQLETVLVNIAVNARDAMNDTGTLYISACAEKIEPDQEQSQINLLSPGRYLRITISDTGAGMTPEVLARACEPFFSTKEIGQGTGLGLAMAKGFAEQSGGALEIETELGRGTSVKLWFPAAEDAACPPARRLPGTALPEQRRDNTILIVDDDPLVLDILVRQMERRGFAVRRAAAAATALDHLDASVRLVITDLSMPGMDGLALIEELHRRRPELPTILLTGFPGKALDIEPNAVFCVMRKPANADDLAQQVDRMLAAQGNARHLLESTS
ncbi:MAG: response regulator [Rhodopseudomonas palustris]|uniref:histidine kinase n=1 Tax=Rhodopseudomonas palustris TaxID=1076 RepID=A0A933S086_RHOPL|nr:response regulator [Rhodopseudomonas palustris]